LLANTIAGMRYTVWSNPIYVRANATSRHAMFRYANRNDFIVRPSDCTLRVILPSLLLPCRSYFFLLFVHQTEPSCAVLYGNDDGVGGGGGRSGSRKSQINPFVIPHRSFQPVRISTTSLLYATSAPSQNSSPFLFRLPTVLSREILQFHSLYLSLPPFFPSNITLFSPFFFLFLPIPVAPSLACLLTLSFFFRLSTVHIFRSRNFTSSPRLDSNSSQRGVPRSHLFRLLFLYDPIETSSPFMRTIITISGAANCNWNGVRPVLKLRSSQSGAPTGIGRHAAGNETKRFIETAWTKRFFKLFVFLSFLAKSRAIILLYSIVRARAYACVLSLWFIYRAIILHHRMHFPSTQVTSRLSYVMRYFGFLSL